MKVKDIMTKDVACLRPDDTVEHAAQVMKQYNVGSIPVCRNNQVVGIVTDRDITLRSIAKGENTSTQIIGEIMTTNPVIGTSDMDIHDAARIMSERQIRRLPITDNNTLVGILSLGDIAVENDLQNSAEQALSNISEPCTPEM